MQWWPVTGQRKSNGLPKILSWFLNRGAKLFYGSFANVFLPQNLFIPRKNKPI
jgi:hypothetical protein